LLAHRACPFGGVLGGFVFGGFFVWGMVID